MDISEIISKENLLRINKGFGGTLRSDSSIDFAFDKLQEKKLGPYNKLAYLVRAILVDHPFSDGNKRTATFVCLAFANKYNKEADRDLLLHHIISISKNNIHKIRNIEWRLKNAIK
ncbi:Fic family protein [Candidatus Pacearchaeota archaeon]|nr:Fic family protein [Candidatus Pacearchaeota archaeon]